MRSALQIAVLLAISPITGGADAKLANAGDSNRDAGVEHASVLRGRVLSDLEAPLRRALVLAFATKTAPPIGAAVTNEEGKFSFSDLPPGRYVLLAIHGHHSPGRSAPVVIGQLGSPFPIRLTLERNGVEI